MIVAEQQEQNRLVGQQGPERGKPVAELGPQTWALAVEQGVLQFDRVHQLDLVAQRVLKDLLDL